MDRRLISNTLAAIVLRGSVMATQLGIVLLPTLFVEVGTFGAIAFVISIVELFKTFADFGVDTLATREFARITDAQPHHTGVLHQFAQRVMSQKLICATIGYVAVLLFYGFTQPANQFVLGALGGLLIFTGLWAGLPLSFFQAKLRTHEIALPIVLVNLGMFGLTALILIWQPVAQLALASLLLTEVISGVLLWRVMRKAIGPSLATHVPSFALFGGLSLLQMALPIGITASIIALYGQISAVALKTWFGDVATGNYLFAERLTQPPLLIAGAFAYSVFSRLSALIANDTDAATLKYNILRYISISAVFGVFCALLISQLGMLIVPVVMPNFVTAVPVLQLMAIVLGLRILNSCLTRVIHAYGHFNWTMWGSLLNLIVVIVLTPIGILRAGSIGVASALMISEVVNFIVQAWLVRRAWYLNKLRAI